MLNLWLLLRILTKLAPTVTVHCCSCVFLTFLWRGVCLELLTPIVKWPMYIFLIHHILQITERSVALFPYTFYFLKRFYLLIFRQRGREREAEGEGEKHQCVVATHSGQKNSRHCSKLFEGKSKPWRDPGLKIMVEASSRLPKVKPVVKVGEFLWEVVIFKSVYI